MTRDLALLYKETVLMQRLIHNATSGHLVCTQLFSVVPTNVQDTLLIFPFDQKIMSVIRAAKFAILFVFLLTVWGHVAEANRKLPFNGSIFGKRNGNQGTPYFFSPIIIFSILVHLFLLYVHLCYI